MENKTQAEEREKKRKKNIAREYRGRKGSA